MANEIQLTIPWNNDNYYLINGMKYAYETLDGVDSAGKKIQLDFIWLYDCMGKIYIEDIKAEGYQVTKPKLAYNDSQARTKMPSAGYMGMRKAA